MNLVKTDTKHSELLERVRSRHKWEPLPHDRHDSNFQGANSSGGRIASVLAGKKICLALDNASFETAFQGMLTAIDNHDIRHRAKADPKAEVDWTLLIAPVTILNSATLLRVLETLNKDILIIQNPADVDEKFDDFKTALAGFRQKNPQAVVVVGYPPESIDAVKLESLVNHGLVDYVETNQNSGTFDLKYAAACIIEARTLESAGIPIATGIISTVSAPVLGSVLLEGPQ